MVALVAMLMVAGTGSARPLSSAAQVHQLRRGIVWQRVHTWKYQDAAGVRRTPTERAERRTSSVAFLGWIDRLWLKRKKAAYRHWLRVKDARPAGGSVNTIICRVFGSGECGEATRVAYCESRDRLDAVNGQYEGIFQMGSHERATYATIGYSTVYEQVVAAHNYFVAAGWGPWSCA